MMSASRDESGAYVGHSRVPALALVAMISHTGVAHGVWSSEEKSSSAFVASSSTGKTKTQSAVLSGLEGIDVRESGILSEIFTAHPDVRELVLEAARELERAFGARATIAVEPLVDPEASGATPHVVVIAVTTLSFEQSDPILESVLEGWWLDNQSRADYLVYLATELV